MIVRCQRNLSGFCRGLSELGYNFRMTPNPHQKSQVNWIDRKPINTAPFDNNCELSLSAILCQPHSDGLSSVAYQYKSEGREDERRCSAIFPNSTNPHELRRVWQAQGNLSCRTTQEKNHACLEKKRNNLQQDTVLPDSTKIRSADEKIINSKM